jgi:cytochrome d oxidase subunit CydB
MFFKKEESRRVALNAIGPVWDGNEVWLVIGGGTLFAGFPVVYGTVFSAFYVPFMLFLVALIFRAISIEFRSKEPMPWWRKMWDWSYSIASIVVALSLGVVLGNIIQGLPIGADREFHGTWLSFLNPYALLVGLTTVALFAQHGAVYLLLKTENGHALVRAAHAAGLPGPALVVCRTATHAWAGAQHWAADTAAALLPGLYLFWLNCGPAAAHGGGRLVSGAGALHPQPGLEPDDLQRSLVAQVAGHHADHRGHRRAAGGYLHRLRVLGIPG